MSHAPGTPNTDSILEATYPPPPNTTFTDLVAVSTQEDTAKVDFLTAAPSFGYSSDLGDLMIDGGVGVARRPPGGFGDQSAREEFGRAGADAGICLTEHAEAQLAQLARVPYRVFARQPAHIKNNLLRHWLPFRNEERTQARGPLLVRGLRPQGGDDPCGRPTIRAILSSSYGIINDTQVLEMVAKLLGTSKVRPRRINRSMQGIWLKMTFPDTIRRLPDGSEFFCGLMVGNSEVGSRSVSVEPFIYRAACTNDLVVDTDASYRQIHRGHGHRTMTTAVSSAIEAAFAGYGGEIEAIEDAMTLDLQADLSQALKAISTRGMSDEYRKQSEERARVAASAHDGPPVWMDVVNGLTNAALELNTDDRVEAERYAGRVLRMRKPGLVRERGSMPTYRLN